MIIPIKYRLKKSIIFEILKSLTLNKFLIIFISGISYLFKTKKSASVPFILTLQLTYDCNFSCIMCQKSSVDPTVYSSNPIHMDFNKLEKLLNKNSKSIVYLKLIGGEPLLYKHIKELLSLLNKLNIKYSLITNGSLLNEEICRLILKNCLEISISIDSADKKMYKHIRRGGDLSLLEKNIQFLNKIKKESNNRTPFLRVSVAVFLFNITGLKRVVDFSKKHNINELVILEGSFYNTPYIKNEDFIKNDPELIKKIIPEILNYADKTGVLINFKSLIFSKTQNDIQASAKKEMFKNCVYHYSTIVLSPNFDAALCAMSDYVENLTNKSFKEIWNSDNSKIVKNRVMLKKSEYPKTCRYCKQYCSNNYKSYIDYQESNHYWRIDENKKKSKPIPVKQ